MCADMLLHAWEICMFLEAYWAHTTIFEGTWNDNFIVVSSPVQTTRTLSLCSYNMVLCDKFGCKRGHAVWALVGESDVTCKHALPMVFIFGHDNVLHECLKSAKCACACAIGNFETTHKGAFSNGFITLELFDGDGASANRRNSIH